MLISVLSLAAIMFLHAIDAAPQAPQTPQLTTQTGNPAAQGGGNVFGAQLPTLPPAGGIASPPVPLPLTTSCTVVEVAKRVDCGYPGITPGVCISKGCCYDSSLASAIWCFNQQVAPLAGGATGSQGGNVMAANNQVQAPQKMFTLPDLAA